MSETHEAALGVTHRCLVILEDHGNDRATICNKPTEQFYRIGGSAFAQIIGLCDEHWAVQEADNLYWKNFWDERKKKAKEGIRSAKRLAIVGGLGFGVLIIVGASLLLLSIYLRYGA